MRLPHTKSCVPSHAQCHTLAAANDPNAPEALLQWVLAVPIHMRVREAVLKPESKLEKRPALNALKWVQALLQDPRTHNKGVLTWCARVRV